MERQLEQLEQLGSMVLGSRSLHSLHSLRSLRSFHHHILVRLMLKVEEKIDIFMLCGQTLTNR